MESLKKEQTSIQRQLQALKGLDDPRSLTTVKDLEAQLQQIRHSMTSLKPTKDQLNILASVLEKKKQELVTTTQQRDELNVTMGSLKVEINDLEAK
eukprot:5437829-Karenia_brevis.AAC.1